MTEQKLQELVTRAVHVDREIAELTNELKTLKAALVTEAASRAEEQIATEGGGTSWMRRAADGSAARVTFPGPALKSSIDGEGKVIEEVKAAAGRHFERLFRPVIHYEPVAEFRRQALDFLGVSSRKLIKLCTRKSNPSVSFETKEEPS